MLNEFFNGGSKDVLYTEDLFAATIYVGTGADQTITNGIDLAGEGGFVWIKCMNQTESPVWFDAEVGKTGTYYDQLRTDSNEKPSTDQVGGVTTFNSDGFTVGGAQGRTNNTGGFTYVAWTFRKAPGFMTSVRYTGSGGTKRNISHDLDAVPGMMIVKRLDEDRDWRVYHKGMGPNYAARLNSTAQPDNLSGFWSGDEPTSTVFTVGNDGDVNTLNGEYIAYLFADDDQRFGKNGDESVIACASFDNDAGVDLGWEPQWVMTRQRTLHSDAQDWNMVDAPRVMRFDNYAPTLKANKNDSESDIVQITPMPNGFDAVSPYYGRGWMSLAIRRPHKPAESGEQIFKASTASGGSTIVTGFDTDWAIYRRRNGTNNTTCGTRFTGNDDTLKVNLDIAMSGSSNSFEFNGRTGRFEYSESLPSPIAWLFSRSAGAFDMITYTGNGTARDIPHNLGAVPELMIYKGLDTSGNWTVHTTAIDGSMQYMYLNLADQAATSNVQPPTSEVVSLANDSETNRSGDRFVGWLFASLAGVTSVGSYTGNGESVGSQDIDCGFTAGARFILVKRTDSSGDWIVFDTVRGIVAGAEDPYLRWNESAQEGVYDDYIDPLASGFTVKTNGSLINEQGGTYIYLAIA